MAEIAATIPLFFNMHNTSHSGPLTSFPSTKDYNIFAKLKPEKIDEDRWHTKWYYVRGGISDTVPKRWTSLAEALCPKFPKTALVKAQIATLKRLFVKLYHYKIFCEEGVLIQASLPRSLTKAWRLLLVGVYLLLLPIPEKEAPSGIACFIPSTSELLQEEESDSAPKAMMGYSANYLGFPLLSLAAMNASYVIARRTDLLDDAREEACEKERAFQLRVKELEEENEKLKVTPTAASKEKKETTAQAMVEIRKHDALQKLQLQLVPNQTTKRVSDYEQKAKAAADALPRRVQEAIHAYQRSHTFHLEAGKETAHCLCRFTKTYRDVNHSIVANYEDFIQRYPKEWFAPLSLAAPLTPEVEDEEEEEEKEEEEEEGNCPSTSANPPTS
ncbi:hypothetical protein LIER_27881 [Lithospermum erythrorhizon]|uniref:Uncharacterized protein n=1 Tax=Lithospermum erythrorhizon TaxID=34254 RepID=A0AAV3RDM7_LITER